MPTFDQSLRLSESFNQSDMQQALRRAVQSETVRLELVVGGLRIRITPARIVGLPAERLRVFARFMLVLSRAFRQAENFGATTLALQFSQFSQGRLAIAVASNTASTVDAFQELLWMPAEIVGYDPGTVSDPPSMVISDDVEEAATQAAMTTTRVVVRRIIL